MLANKKFKTVLAKNNKFPELDSFPVGWGGWGEKNIRYLNKDDIWFCVNDVLSAVGYYGGESSFFCDKVIKRKNLIKVMFEKIGPYFWFCNIDGVYDIITTQLRRGNTAFSQRELVFKLCKKMLGSGSLAKHEIEEFVDEREVVELVPINKENLEIGAINLNGKIYFAGSGLLRLLGYDCPNIYFKIKNCGINDSNYIKLLCRFKGRTSERFLVDQVATRKLLDEYMIRNPKKAEIREWLLGDLDIAENKTNAKNEERKEVKEMENLKLEKNSDDYYKGFIDGVKIMENPSAESTKLLDIIFRLVSNVFENNKDDEKLRKVAKIVEFLHD